LEPIQKDEEQPPTPLDEEKQRGLEVDHRPGHPEHRVEDQQVDPAPDKILMRVRELRLRQVGGAKLPME
jgi:hypothetical protein